MNIEAPGMIVKEPIVGAALMKFLPQRFPYLMLDRIEAYEPWKWAHGVKCVSKDEPYLTNDTDENWPMHYVIESLGQLAIGLINVSNVGDSPATVLLGNVSGVKFFDPAPLGSQIDMEIRIDRVIGDQFVASGRADNGDRPIMTMDSIVCKFISGDQTNEN